MLKDDDNKRLRPVGLIQMVKNKRVAVLLYGQPRFLEETHKSIKQEFEIDGVKTDYFYHAWNQLGYGWEQQHENENINLEKNKLTELYNKLYSPLAGGVTDNIEQSEIISNTLLSTKKTIVARKTKSLNSELYFSGQFYSLQKAFEYLDSYVKKNKINYDVVVACRTENFFPPPQCYESEEGYQSRKKIFYIKSALDYPDYLFPPPYIVYLRGKYNSPHFRDSLETYVKVQNIEHMDEGGLLISHREDCPLFREKIVKTKILKKIDYYDTLWFSNSFSHCSYNTAERYYSNLFKSYLCTRIENFMREYKRQVIKTPSPRGEAICGNNSLWNKVNIRSLSHYISFIPTFRVINNRSNAWKLNDRFSLQSGSYEDLVSQVELYYSEKKIKNKDCGIYKDKE